MILGHIGARKGSKGVVGKNFRPIAGKPLIDWSLDQLFRNKNIDAVVVSTDDPEVYEHGLKRSPFAKTIFAPPWISSIAEFGGTLTSFAMK